MGKKKKSKNGNYQTKLHEQQKVVAADIPETARYTPGPVQLPSDYEKKWLQEYMHFTDTQMARIANLTKLYPGLTLRNMTKMAGWLTSEYNRALVAKDICLDTKQLLDKDRIDLTDISEEELDEYVKTAARAKFEQSPENRFYYILPCFQEGTVVHRLSRYIYYKVLDIDTEKQMLKIYLHDYSNLGKEHGMVSPYKDEYICGVYGVVNIQLEPPDEKEPGDLYQQSYSIEVEGGTHFPELYRTFSPKQLGWNDMYAHIWQRFILQNADNVQKVQDEKEILPLVNLTILFVTQILAANCIMAERRMKVIDNAAGDETDNAAKADESRTTPPDPSRQSERKPPERIVRHVGKIKIISRNKPQRATKTSIRRYYVTEWNRRGHIRHLASGKEVYIKPSVFHRRTNGKDPAVKQTTPTTIKIHHEQEVT